MVTVRFVIPTSDHSIRQISAWRMACARSSRCSAIKSENIRGCSKGRERRIGVPRSIERSNIQCPLFRITPPDEGVCDVLVLPPDLNAPAARLELRKGWHCVCTPPRFVCATCAPGDQTRYKRVQFGLVWGAHVCTCSCSSPL